MSSHSGNARGMSALCIALVLTGSIAFPFDCSANRSASSDGWARRFSTGELEKDSKKLLPLLEEPERPARWRRQLAHWRSMKEAFLQAEAQRTADEVRDDIETLTDHRLMLAIAAELRVTGRSAPSGTIPDMLLVLDEQKSVRVQNVGKRPLSVVVWRYAEFEWAGESKYEWCPMAAVRLGGDFHTPVELQSEEFEDFDLSDHKDCILVNQSTVSFEIYEDDTLVWASESMLARRERIAKREIAKLQEKIEASTREARADND